MQSNILKALKRRKRRVARCKQKYPNFVIKTFGVFYSHMKHLMVICHYGHYVATFFFWDCFFSFLAPFFLFF
jgi:hypothetical protein